MYLEISSEAIIAITENKMLVKEVIRKTNDKVIIKLCEMYIDLAESITDNVKDTECKKTE